MSKIAVALPELPDSFTITAPNTSLLLDPVTLRPTSLPVMIISPSQRKDPVKLRAASLTMRMPAPVITPLRVTPSPGVGGPSIQRSCGDAGVPQVWFSKIKLPLLGMEVTETPGELQSPPAN